MKNGLDEVVQKIPVPVTDSSAWRRVFIDASCISAGDGF
jgi:hypothetical protein